MHINQTALLSASGSRAVIRSANAQKYAPEPVGTQAAIKQLLTPTLKYTTESAPEELSNSYTIVKELDRCRSSVFVVVNNKTGDLAIAKKVESTDGDDLVTRSRLDHKNLVLCDDFVAGNDGRYLIYPYVEGISLHTAITIIHNEKQIRTDSDIDRHEANGELNGDLRYKLHFLNSMDPNEREETLKELKKKLLISLADVAEALERMQERGLSHGDLKPSNIISSFEGNYLIDFEGTRKFDEPLVSKPVGRSSGFIAPEELNHPTTNQLSSSLSKEGDQFNFGTVLYMLLTGEHPFFKFNEDTEDRLKNREAPFPINEKETYGLNDLVMSCLNYNPKLRPPFSEIAQRLRSI